MLHSLHNTHSFESYTRKTIHLGLVIQPEQTRMKGGETWGQLIPLNPLKTKATDMLPWFFLWDSKLKTKKKQKKDSRSTFILYVHPLYSNSGLFCLKRSLHLLPSSSYILITFCPAPCSMVAMQESRIQILGAKDRWQDYERTIKEALYIRPKTTQAKPVPMLRRQEAENTTPLAETVSNPEVNAKGLWWRARAVLRCAKGEGAPRQCNERNDR